MSWESHRVTETHELKYRDIIREREGDRKREREREREREKKRERNREGSNVHCILVSNP